MGDLARKCQRQATRFDGQFPGGQMMRRRHQNVVSPGAETAYRQSIRLDPDAPDVRRKLADHLLDMGKRKEAEATGRHIPDDHYGATFLYRLSASGSAPNSEPGRAASDSWSSSSSASPAQVVTPCRSASACRQGVKLG